MKLKNAGITSEKELETRLRNGEIFYTGGTAIFYSEGFDDPFRVVFAGSAEPSTPLAELRGYFTEFKIEYEWEEALKDEEVLCWVSDENPDDKRLAALINDKDFSGPSPRYKTGDGFEWVYATPVEPSECLNMED